MKRDFFDYMDALMEQNPDIYLIMAGLGWPRTPEFISKFPTRAFNTEASEQTALDIAVGLAYENKIPFVYTITPFLYRGFETIRTFINNENLQVIMVGAGRDEDYSIHDGYSHDARDIKEILGTQKNIDLYFPSDKEDLRKTLDSVTVISGPSFISLTR